MLRLSSFLSFNLPWAFGEEKIGWSDKFKKAQKETNDKKKTENSLPK